MKILKYSVTRTGEDATDRNFDQIKVATDSLAAGFALIAKAASSLTNNVALTGTAGVLPDFTNGVTYATDYANLHATISQMAARLTALEKQLLQLTT